MAILHLFCMFIYMCLILLQKHKKTLTILNYAYIMCIIIGNARVSEDCILLTYTAYRIITINYNVFANSKML